MALQVTNINISETRHKTRPPKSSVSSPAPSESRHEEAPSTLRIAAAPHLLNIATMSSTEVMRRVRDLVIDSPRQITVNNDPPNVSSIH